MQTEEDLSRLESALEQPDPRLHLYTLSQRSRVKAAVAAPTGMDEFLALQREIESAKSGG